MKMTEWLQSIVGLVLAPLMVGVIQRVKAWMGGRKGQPLLQCYYELWKLAQKGGVYSRASTWILRLGTVAVAGVLMMATLMVPVGGTRGVISFPGDVAAFVLLLGLARVLTVLGGLDTGSSFEGMGASREMLLGVLSEPVILLTFAVLVRWTAHASLAEVCKATRGAAWSSEWPVAVLLFAAVWVLLLMEAGRVPVDDPATHLELTMIHEVIVLDHSGPELALMQYAHALKMWVWSVICVNMVVPGFGAWWKDLVCGVGGVFGVAMGVGVIESSMARWRLNKLPHLGAGGLALVLLAFLIDMWRG